MTDDVRSTLDRLIQEKREDYAALSRMIGRSSSYIHQFIRRGVPRRLAEDDRRTLAQYLGVDEKLLGKSAEAPAEARAPEAGAERVVFASVPRLDVGVSAGPGMFAEGEEGQAPIGFDPRWLRRVTGTSPDKLSMIRVRGDSMVPTLNDDDDILVEQTLDQRELHDGVYVLRRDEALMVKRLAFSPLARKVTIKSDNPAYDSWPDVAIDGVEIIGRVVWAGRRIV